MYWHICPVFCVSLWLLLLGNAGRLVEGGFILIGFAFYFLLLARLALRYLYLHRGLMI